MEEPQQEPRPTTDPAFAWTAPSVVACILWGITILTVFFPQRYEYNDGFGVCPVVTFYTREGFIEARTANPDPNDSNPELTADKLARECEAGYAARTRVAASLLALAAPLSFWGLWRGIDPRRRWR